LTPAERVRPLLRPSARDAPVHDGVIDLLGGREPEITGRAQRLMFTDLVPAIYERWWRPGLGRVAKGAFGPGMADGVLDVACGPGNFTRDFASVVGPTGLAVGIDASTTMLARAVRDTPAGEDDNVAYVRGDAVELPFRDQSFDAVCCFAALHMFAEPFRALDHMTRVLTAGGRIAILTSVRLRSAALRAWSDVAQRWVTGGMRLFDRGEITSALRERGFDQVNQRISGFAQFVGGRLGQ
jgi:ubiquinone/menaquinone biosynthesis C-methylase UbiE